jgi:RNA polymerase sigma-70 factor, ECF subfamily
MNEPALPPEIEELLTHQGWVRRLCRHLAADEIEADEIEQETWRRTIESPPRHRKNLKSWFSAVVRSALVHRAREERGSKARPKRIVSMDSEASSVHPESGERPDSTAERRETFELLQRLVAELEAPYGEVIFLRYIEGHAPRRIAKKLGVPLSTVQSRLYRGLQILRRRVHARYGGEWRARCLVFVPSLPSLAASTLTTTIAMSKPIKLTLAAAAVLLAVPMYSVLTDSGGVEPEQTNEPASPVLVQGAAQNEFAESLGAPELFRVPASPVGDAQTQIRVVDEDGNDVEDFRMSVYRDGEQRRSVMKQAATFTWPIEEDKAGLVFIGARGRAPYWEWLDPKLSQQIVLPTGRELTLRNVAGNDPIAFLEWIELDFSQLTPTASSDLFHYRRHWGQDGSDPFNFYTSKVRAEMHASHARYWGIPAEFKGETQLSINTARWEGAEHDGQNWHLPVNSGTDSLELKIYPWPAWTLQVALPQNAAEFPGHAVVLLGDSSRNMAVSQSTPDPNDTRLLRLSISNSLRIPPPDRVDGWTASLQVAWNATRHHIPIVLPLEPGDLGRFTIPEPEAFQIHVVDSLGHSVPNLVIRSTDGQFSGGITDEDGTLVVHSLAGPEVRQTPPTLDLYPQAVEFMPTVQSVTLLDQGLAKMVLESAHGLSVQLRVFEGESDEPMETHAQVVIGCIGDDQRRPGGLFGRDLSVHERRRLAPDMDGGWGGKGDDFWALDLYSELDRESGKWNSRVLGLNPTHPVLLRVIAQGAELYREEFSSWPTGQLVERDLELHLPRAIQVRGVVVDQKGERIPNVFVRLNLPDLENNDRRTDAFGEFDFGDVHASGFEISASGSRGTYLESPPIEVQPNEDGIAELRIELQHTQPMQIQVMHADGRPFEGDDLYARVIADGQRLSGGLRRIEPGLFEVQAPPTGEIRVVVHYENWSHGATFQLGQEPHVLHIPDHVALNVQLPEGAGPGGRRTILRCRERVEGGYGTLIDLYGSKRKPPSVAGAFQERPSLPPGEYRAYLQQSADGWVTISDVIEFDVLPATPVTLDFRSAKPIPEEK